MDTKKVVDLISLVVGEKNVTAKKRERLETILELAMTVEPVTVKQNEVMEDPKPNEMNVKVDKNEIDLQNATHFRFPEDLNVAVEGQEGTQKMKIFPDGYSERSTNGNSQA